MPSRFRLSGFFDPKKSGAAKQRQEQQAAQQTPRQDEIIKRSTTTATTFQASHGAIFQLDEVVRPQTARAAVSRRYSFLERKHHDSNNRSYFSASNHNLISNNVTNSTSSGSSTSNSHVAAYRRTNSHRTIRASARLSRSNLLLLDDEQASCINDAPSMTQQQQMVLPLQMHHVKNVLAEYCFALDNKQYDKLAKLFAPNCLAFYNAVAPPQPRMSQISDEKKSDSATADSAGGSQGLRGRDAVVRFLQSRVHDKTTIHTLSTQHLEFEYSSSNENSSASGSEYFDRVYSPSGLGTPGGQSAGGGGAGGVRVTACIAKTYFTANTFTIPTWERPDVPFVHTVQHGQYVDVLRPANAGAGGSGAGDGHGGWEIHHRRVIVVVPRLIAPSMLANGSHEQVEQWLYEQRANQTRAQQSHQQPQSQQHQQSQQQQQHQQEQKSQQQQQDQQEQQSQRPSQQPTVEIEEALAALQPTTSAQRKHSI